MWFNIGGRVKIIYGTVGLLLIAILTQTFFIEREIPDRLARIREEVLWDLGFETSALIALEYSANRTLAAVGKQTTTLPQVIGERIDTIAQALDSRVETSVDGITDVLDTQLTETNAQLDRAITETETQLGGVAQPASALMTQVNTAAPLWLNCDPSDEFPHGNPNCAFNRWASFTLEGQIALHTFNQHFPSLIKSSDLISANFGKLTTKWTAPRTKKETLMDFLQVGALGARIAK